MTKGQHAARLLMIAVLAICAGLWWWTSRTPPPSVDSNSRDAAANLAPATPEAADAAAAADAATHQHVLASIPMPAADLPLRDTLPSLQSRADAGDSLAACRLGVELLRCAALRSDHPDHDQLMAQQQAEQEAGANREGADQIALGRALHAQLREACSAVPAKLVDRAHHYVRQAALAGEPEAMVRYAAGQTITAGMVGMDFVTKPGFDQWRREARPMLMRALDEGVPEAALLLVMAQARDGGLLAMLMPRDDVEASASLTLARELFGDLSAIPPFAPGPGRPATPPLDPDRAAAAAQMAADWHAQGYGGRRLELTDSTASLQSDLGWGWDYHEGLPGKPRAVPCTDSVEATQ